MRGTLFRSVSGSFRRLVELGLEPHTIGLRMSELKDTETAASKFDDKLHKLIKRAKKQRGMLWPSVVSKLELARADVKAMIKVYDSGPK
jgi:hypothetical protein